MTGGSANLRDQNNIKKAYTGEQNSRKDTTPSYDRHLLGASGAVELILCSWHFSMTLYHYH